jgi:nucleoside-diphosphate-sugar epimerase
LRPHLSRITIIHVTVLVVGGSGYVAGLIVPGLAERHAVRIFDPRPPRTATNPAVEHVSGDATDFAALGNAMDGIDVVVHAAMGSHDEAPADGFASLYDVNVKSVHLTLRAAFRAGIGHAVYISSMSVFRELNGRRLDESVPADATDPYGLTKRLGEQVCQAVATEWGRSVNVLRLAYPTRDEVWPAWGYRVPPEVPNAADGTPIHATAASDLARAVLAAIDYRNGFEIFTISGDGSARLWSTAKARRLLGWAPTFKA